jgi:hypothetical protein
VAADNVAIAEEEETSPITYIATKWWGYVLCAMYLLYGGVKVILGFLDRAYGDLSAPLASLIIGLAVAIVMVAYRDRKGWGWYGLVTLNVLVILLAVFQLSFVGNIVLLILGLVALAALFAPATKSHIFGQR